MTVERLLRWKSESNQVIGDGRFKKRLASSLKPRVAAQSVFAFAPDPENNARLNPSERKVSV